MGYPSRSTPLIPLRLSRVGLAADESTGGAGYVAPFACHVHAIIVGCSKLGGSTPHTDVDVTVKKGSVDLLSSRVAIVDSSAIVARSAAGTLSTVSGALEVAAGDVLYLDVDITGGSSPLTDVWVDVWVSRS